MSSSGQVSSVVSQRYANALIELAHDSKKLDQVEKDLGNLAAMIQGSGDLARVISSPLYAHESLLKAFLALADAAKFDDITKNFLGVLIQNGRLGILPDILQVFKNTLDQSRGGITINVEVAQDLSPSQEKDLQKSLSKALGKDVVVHARVKPDILGGMIVTVGSTMIDDSVRRKLERLKVSMGAGANENLNLQDVS